MKKLISLIFVALISSQMWGTIVYAYYANGSNATMGKLGLSTSSSFATTQTPARVSDGYSYISISGVSGMVRLSASAINGCSFDGWYTDAAATTKLSGDANFWWKNVGSASTVKVYAKFNKPSSPSRSCATATSTGSAESVTVYMDGTDAGKTKNFALPSDVVDMGDAGYWCKHNIGTTNETADGSYYQWGSFYDNNYVHTYTYPTTADLLCYNDAASFAMGIETARTNGYCIPTQTEWNSLINNCSWNRDGTNGYYEITNTTTGNSIKLSSLTGYKQKYSASGNIVNTDQGSAGYYWTSTYNSGSPYYFKCNKTSNSYSCASNSAAKNAMFIRPIYKMTGSIYTLTITVGSYTYTYKGVAGQQISVTVNTPNTHTSQWSDDNTISTASARTLTISNNNNNNNYTVVYTLAGPTEYSITYHENDGSDVADGTYTQESDDITLPTTITKTGYTFAGWYANSDLSTGGVVTSIPAGSTGNKEFWAKWNIINYTITYNGLEGASNSNPATYTIETATFSLANPGTRTGYTFTGWTCGGNAITQIAVGSTGDKTITANWTANNYSVTFRKSADDQKPAVKSDYHYGDEITNRPATDPQRLGDDTHTYTFIGWHLEGTENTYSNAQVDAMTVSGNMVFTARFDEQIIEVGPVTYNITIGNFTANANGQVVITSQGNTQTVSPSGGVFTFGAGKSVTIQAVPNAYYHFNGWVEDNDEEAVIDIRTLGSDLTYTPTFASNTSLNLEDNHNEAYYTSLYGAHTGEVLTVIMQGRQLTEGSWMTFCAPFDFNIPAGHPFRGAVYELQDATMSGTNTAAYISLDFRRTYVMHANVPYLIVPTMTTLSDLEFDHVTIDDTPAQIPVTSESGEVQFISLPWQTTLTNDAQKPDFYLATGNNLRYVKTEGGTTFRAFRAYFHRLKDLNATPAPRRIVISLDGVETTKELTEDGEVVDVTEKRIENGVLIIERNGVRYNAQGQVAE